MKTPTEKWERGYHQGEIVERSTMGLIAKFTDDNDRDLAIKVHNERVALVQALEQAHEALRLVWADKAARFETVHKGMPMTAVLRNAISFAEAALSDAKGGAQ